MLNTTTHNIDGKEIKEYLGVVTGEAISGANFVKDFLASIKDFTGGRSGAYEEELSKARNIAFDEMNQKAREMGANGVVGIDIDYGTLGDTGSMLMVSVNGTAIKYWLYILTTSSPTFLGWWLDKGNDSYKVIALYRIIVQYK